MQKNNEIVGFSKGPKMNRTRVHEELQEAAREEAEEAAELSKIENGMAQFELALHGCEFYGWYAKQWQPIVDQVDHEALAQPILWQKSFKKYNSGELTPHTIFSILPTEIQNDPEIQDIFFSQPNFVLKFLPRTVLERIDRKDIVELWIKEPIDELVVNHTPWKLFTEDEKRYYIEGVVKAGFFKQLESQRKYFTDAITPAEWDDIAREQFRNDKDNFLVTAQKDIDRLITLFGLQELRLMLKESGEASYGRDRQPMYYALSYAALKKLEYGTDEFSSWKENQINNPSLESGFDEFEKLNLTERTEIVNIMAARSGKYREEFRLFISKKLPLLIQQRLPPTTVKRTLESITRMASSWSSYDLPGKEIADGIFAPTIESQGAAAFQTFETLCEVVDCFDAGNIQLMNIILPNKDSTKIFRNIMSKTGARFQDFMTFFLDTNFGKDRLGVLQHGGHQPLSEEKNIIPFIDSKLPWTSQIFNRFKELIASGRSIKEVTRELTASVQEQIKEIQNGECSEKKIDENKLSLVSHVFPPAIGVSRNEYAQLITRRNDRQSDVPDEWEVFQGREVTFSLGKWELKKGTTFDTAPWERMGEAIAEINDKKIITIDKEKPESNEKVVGPAQIIEIGRRMIQLLQLDNASLRKEALKDGYALFLARGGAKLPTFVTDREDGLRLFEWSKDALRDVIDIALRAYREADPTSFTSDITAATRREITPKAKKNIVRAISSITLHKTMSESERHERIQQILVGAGVSLDEMEVNRLLIEINTAKDTSLVDNIVEVVLDEWLAKSTGPSQEAGKISSMIVSKLLGADAEAMDKELKKWSFVEGLEGGEQRTLQFQISKRKLHAAAGLNMGVCVAIDDQLWNKEEFSNVIMFGDDGIARGGMHFETVQDNGETYLSLPGINPSLAVLREINPSRLVQTMLTYAKDCARAIGAKAVLIPKNSVIFSNREELHGIISGMNLATRSLSQDHQFSYSPFPYSWKDAYEIPVN